MLRLNKVCEYGVLALSYMANKSDPTSAREIAENLHLPYEITAKTLQKLRDSGLITSQMGINGGYRLTSPLNQISCARVIEAIEGPLSLSDCEAGQDCNLKDNCRIRVGLQGLNDKMRALLDSVPVSEMLLPAAPAVSTNETHIS
ncbi:MAG: Rrf2 family transcriptional regulator [Oligoflexia bacterium]|nr:Rrf2 family transcriptional regulator [Oligoflexia bacterium]